MHYLIERAAQVLFNCEVHEIWICLEDERKQREKYGLVTLRVRTREKGLMKADVKKKYIYIYIYLFIEFCYKWMMWELSWIFS